MNTTAADSLALALKDVQAGNLAAAAARCEEALAARPDDVEALKILSGVRFMEGRLDEALAVLSRAAERAPTDARVQANLGSILTRLGRFEEAVASYRRALALDASYAEAHYNLGATLSALYRFEEAIAAYDKVLALAPGHSRTLINKGAALSALNRHEEALACYDRILASDPQYGEVQINQGTALQGLHRLDEAAERYEAAVAARPHDAVAHWNKGLTALYRGDLETGWREYEWRWQKPDFGPNRRDYPQPQWRGDGDIAGKTILIFSEQGLGDTLHFCRYAELLAARGATVLVEVQPPLKPLLRNLSGAAQVFARGEALPPFDLQCPMLSLPLAFRTTLATVPANVPYLAPSAEKRAAWQARLGARTKPRIGFAWSGNPTQKNDRNRSIPLARLMAVAGNPRFEFHVMQKDIRAADEEALARLPGLRLHSEELGDFDDTAALIAEMDLIVSVDTASAHLAGAMARPTWIMLPLPADWRWMAEREDNPWYPTVRLFRQPTAGDWDSAIARVAAALDALPA